jgi:aryl-alcohol dehydrogenase-like predicted oxidoreductase
MQYRKFGSSNLEVSALGFGAMHINDERTSDHEAEVLLNQVLDLGINLIDTARGYGLSEERIGKFISHRRSDYVLSTKVGYGIEGHEDWTYSCITAGVDEALKKMNTDYIDIVHLHSCPIGTLQHGEVTRALLDTVKAGKVRVAAYSGENDELDFSIECGSFGGIQTSISICDQRSINSRLELMKQKGIGVIAKRPLAGAIWRFDQSPQTHAEGNYWHRFKTMDINPGPLGWHELALRFAAHLDGVSSCIVGTSKIPHLQNNIEVVDKGALTSEIEQMIRDTFSRHDDNWIGMI